VIITVTLNAAIDKTLEVPNFRLGRRHRSVAQTTMPGGKGVNVARAIKRLGRPVVATGFTGGATGTRVVELLTDESILSDFVRIREESRTNTAVLDPTSGEQTEINERGPAVTSAEVDLFCDKLLYLAQGAQMCVFAGSLPRNVDVDVYAGLIRELKRLGVVTLVDTDGDPLRRAVRAEPDVISPNVLEAEELVGHEFNDEEDHCIAVREMVELGAREAIMTAPDGCYAQMAPTEPGVVSPNVLEAEELVGHEFNDEEDHCIAVREMVELGAAEAIMTAPDGCYAHMLPKDPGLPPSLYRLRVRHGAVEPRSTVGSGDAFLAGFVAARYNGRSTQECLVYGVACGAESTRHLGAGLIDPGQVDRLMDDVEVERPVLSAEVG
jgi:1-phosphofructokinase family hexose kinase